MVCSRTSADIRNLPGCFHHNFVSSFTTGVVVLPGNETTPRFDGRRRRMDFTRGCEPAVGIWDGTSDSDVLLQIGICYLGVLTSSFVVNSIFFQLAEPI